MLFRILNVPLSKVEDLLAKLSGERIFLKFNLSQAYQQVLHDNASKKLVMINTYSTAYCIASGFHLPPSTSHHGELSTIMTVVLSREIVWLYPSRKMANLEELHAGHHG